MIGLLPLITIIKWVAVTYAFISALVFGIVLALTGGKLSIPATASFALSGSSVLQAALLLCFYWGWRKLWRRYPRLNEWLYPDLGGTWSMDIVPGHATSPENPIKAIAVIKQNLLRISMDVRAPKSTSVTLVAVPKKDAESNQPQLYYIFTVTTIPEAGKTSKIYKGAAILDILLSKAEVKGNYWTTEQSSGSYTLYGHRPDA